MMDSSARILPFAALALLGMVSRQDDGAGKDLAAQVARQQAALEAAEQRIERLEAWAEGQAAAAKSFQAATEQAKDAGFAAGINPRSREILLEAWAARAAAAQKGLAPAKKEESSSTRGRRR